MIQGAFFSLFNLVERNRWAQIVLTVGLVLFVVRAKEEVDEARGRAQSDRKWAKRQVQEERRAHEFIDDAREEAEDEADHALEARDTAVAIDPDRMSDAVWARTFGRARPAGAGGGGGH